MPSNQDPHVVRRGHGNWSILKEGNTRDSHTGLTREEAKKKAREIANKEGTNPVYHDKKGDFSKN